MADNNLVTNTDWENSVDNTDSDNFDALKFWMELSVDKLHFFPTGERYRNDPDGKYWARFVSNRRRV
jgi:hypothetical protein